MDYDAEFLTITVCRGYILSSRMYFPHKYLGFADHFHNHEKTYNLYVMGSL